eukprot:Protomagalhaensia_wolfi_Nauph_80__27@NODE_1016_length_1806_cov_225_910017_g732_i2_p2_GENE_NODE_1016_length_1806_cov_225_910017_g732_i2NODE_1016_length_1806_cov_225_910017_g732_i2_p2_ORF_typecomplete_len178_score38_84DUF436/PF04260_12/1_3e75DUF4443/PF14544_6/0_08FIST/PF08495_10/0_078_NODE_1016_length_1806_cov_225_910017_g732_i211441677
MEDVHQKASQAITELLKAAALEAGDVVVVGCSSSEIVGGRIGKASNVDAARAIYTAISPILAKNGLNLAAQCCEHLNRALVVEREVAEKLGLEQVSARPVNNAGGAFATTVFDNMHNPILVERIQAHAGLDIGDTFIGMHLKQVAVPVRLSVSEIGSAHLTAAKTRPKLIGGSRAQY